MRIMQCTISGRDAGGYAFQNVFHITTTDDDSEETLVLSAITDQINTEVIVPYVAAMNDQSAIYDVGAKFVGEGISGYTYHRAQNSTGEREDDPVVGAVAGKIAWYPISAASVGHQYIAGVCTIDYVADIITTGYQTLLNAVLNGFMFFDGSGPGFGFQLVIYNKSTHIAVPVAAGMPMVTPCILSKRIRN